MNAQDQIREYITTAVIIPKDLPRDHYCVIHSLSLALNKSLNVVWKAVKPHWHAEGGVVLSEVLKILDKLKIRYVEVKWLKDKPLDFTMPALGQFKGSFFVFVKNVGKTKSESHVIGVRDGKFVDTAKCPDDTPTLAVLQLKAHTAKDKSVDKFVQGQYRQNGQTLNIRGMQWDRVHTFIRAKNGEGLIKMKNVKVLDMEPPAELLEAFQAYKKKHGR